MSWARLAAVLGEHANLVGEIVSWGFFTGGSPTAQAQLESFDESIASYQRAIEQHPACAMRTIRSESSNCTKATSIWRREASRRQWRQHAASSYLGDLHNDLNYALQRLGRQLARRTARHDGFSAFG
jgi:hypothetical protein